MTPPAGRHFLQIPGPTNVPNRVLSAIAGPTIDHRGPDFSDLTLEVLAGLKKVFKTESNVMVFPGSGTGAWEAALVNTLSPGDRILMFETGQFATLWCAMARKLGIEVDTVSNPRGLFGEDKMKKILYGTTALVAAGMLASGSAAAAEKVQMGVGGYFQAFFVVADQDDDTGEPGANRRNHGVSREGEIIFNGKTTFDNGIQVGVQVQLEAETCTDQIDESFMWFSGGFGRINIGSENSAPYLMHYASPAPSHWAHGINSPNFRHPSGGGNAAYFPHTNPVNISSDAEKITYFTPRFAGVQLGVSYTPDVCEEAIAGSVGTVCGGSYAGLPLDTNALGEAWEGAVNYVGNFGDVGVRGSASYGIAEDEIGGAGRDDPTEWSLGGQISVGGFTVGGAYTDRENNGGTAGADQEQYNLGVRFATGPFGVGVQYAHAEASTGAGVDDDELDAFEVGGSFALGPGVVLSAGIQYIELEADSGLSGAENEATIGFIGTHVAF